MFYFQTEDRTRQHILSRRSRPSPRMCRQSWIIQVSTSYLSKSQKVSALLPLDNKTQKPKYLHGILQPQPKNWRQQPQCNIVRRQIRTKPHQKHLEIIAKRRFSRFHTFRDPLDPACFDACKRFKTVDESLDLGVVVDAVVVGHQMSAFVGGNAIATQVGWDGLRFR